MTLYNFGVWYSNVTFFNVLESTFAFQQEIWNFDKFNALEEKDGFCDHTVQLVFQLHWTFAIGLRLVIIWKFVVKMQPLQKSRLVCDSFATCL